MWKIFCEIFEQLKRTTTTESTINAFFYHIHWWENQVTDIELRCFQMSFIAFELMGANDLLIQPKGLSKSHKDVM